MNKDLSQFLSLSWPFILGWFLLFLHFCAPQIANLEPILNIKAFFVDWPIPISTVFAVRIVITVLSVISFAYPAFRNYSDLFPDFFSMKVFFDDKGISKAIEQFDDRDLARFNLVENWTPEKKKYFEIIESKLKNNHIPGPSGFRFSDPSYNVFSSGNTEFKVRKVAGFQKYRIVSAGGSVEHCCEKAGEVTYKASSEFELMSSSQNLISIKLWDMYLPTGWTHTLSPKFKQIFKNSEGERCWDHTLIAITKIRYFPVPSIGKTLYLYQPDLLDPNVVPICYCEVVYDVK